MQLLPSSAKTNRSTKSQEDNLSGRPSHTKTTSLEDKIVGGDMKIFSNEELNIAYDDNITI